MINASNVSNSLSPPDANGDLVNRVKRLRLDTTSTVPKPRRSSGAVWLPWVLCAMLALAWASIGIKWSKSTGGSGGSQGIPGASVDSAKPSAQIQASTSPVAKPGDIILQQKGSLIPSLQVAVSPIDVAGEVIEVNFKEGDRVAKGFELVKLRPNRYENELNTAKANMAAAEGRLKMILPESVREIEKDQARAELDDAKAFLERSERDFVRLDMQKNSGTVAQQEYDKTVADVRSGKARVIRAEKSLTLLLEGPRREQIDALRADFDASRGRRDEAQRMLDNCVIKAPIPGTVLTKKTDVGGLVNPLAFSSSKDGGGGSSGSVCEIADLSNMEVELDVPERDITKIRDNLECQVTADADVNRIYRGRVDRIMPVADDSKNIIKVRVSVMLPKDEKPGAFLKPKMSAVVTVYNKEFIP